MPLPLPAFGDDHLCAHKSHELAALDGEGLSHGDDTLVAPLRAQHGHSDAGVAAGGLDHGVSRLQLASLLSILGDGAGQAVLHAGQRVEILQLGIDGATLWANGIRNLDARSVPHCFGDVLIDTSASLAAILVAGG